MYGNKKNSHFIVALENNSFSMQPDETGVFLLYIKTVTSSFKILSSRLLSAFQSSR